jgi:hypothetical protein
MDYFCCAGEALAMSQSDEDQTVRRFMEFLKVQDEGFEGSYEEWHWDAYGCEALTAAIRRQKDVKDELEQVGLPA